MPGGKDASTLVGMGGRRTRSHRTGRHSPRVLLVGLTPLVMDVLSGPLSELAEVSAVPFPGDTFEQMADEFGAELVVVDVTYLDEALVRPLLMHRFAESEPVLAFVSERGPAWFDDLRHNVSGHLELADPEHLLGLIGRPNLRLV